MLGVSIFALRNWENNYACPHHRYHPKITKFLGYEPRIKTKEFYGERISAYLKLTGKSRIKLAALVGVTPQAIHKWIHNMSTPPKEFLEKLISVMNGVNLR